EHPGHRRGDLLTQRGERRRGLEQRHVHPPAVWQTGLSPGVRVPLSCPAMKAVILSGGLGSRLSEETTLRPKPMVEIGGKPILWHIMNTFAAHGIKEFVIALGHKAEIVKEYFLNFYALNNDLSIDLLSGKT